MDMSDWAAETRNRPIQICTCGHPGREHEKRGCRVDRSNCNCTKIHSLFVVRNTESFYKPHISTGIGHALIQALLSSNDDVESVELSDRDLGKQPECHRCGRFTSSLMPILMDRYGSRAVTEVSMGRMTRLWCPDCCEREGIEFYPGVAVIIKLAWDRRQSRKGLVP